MARRDVHRDVRGLLVTAAIGLLEREGPDAVQARRLTREIGASTTALYHHFANKQTLLAAMADEILVRASWPASGEWMDRAGATCLVLRDQLLAYRDGAELVATVHSFGLGAGLPVELLTRALEEGGIGVLGPTAVRTLLHFVYGHAVDEQTHLQAAAAGAIDDTGLFDEGHGDDFATGLGIVIAGIQVMRAASNL